MKKRIALALVVLFVACVAFGTLKVSNMVLVPKKRTSTFNPGKYNLEFQNTIICTNDGQNLHAWFIPGNSKEKAIIICHGHGDNKGVYLNHAPYLHNAGYGVFLFDFRGHGENKSTFSTYGCMEKEDLRAAVAFLKDKGFKSIGVLGFSMGASVGVLEAAENTDIKAVVEDSGYATIKGVIVTGASHIYKINLIPFVNYAIFMSELRSGLDFDKYDAVDAIGNMKSPVLIIHGALDTLVPVESANELFKHAKEPKESFIVPEATHVKAYTLRTNEYKNKVLGFFKKYL